MKSLLKKIKHASSPFFKRSNSNQLHIVQFRNRKVYNLVTVKALLITTIFASFCIAQQRIGGILSASTRWNADEGPFILEKDVIVPEGVRLTIAPATRIIVAGSPVSDSSAQIDRTDSLSVSIKVKGGALICIGRSDKRITISPEEPGSGHHSWYGIVLDGAEDPFTEISFTDIIGAFCAVTVTNSRPVIRTSTFEYNHVGINCINGGTAQVVNCIVSRNFASGIKIRESNPRITNSIIAFNHNTGVWCDGLSKIDFEYNCVWGNGDGDMFECDPELGILSKTNKNKDSVDNHFNLYRDPVFTGSVADSIAAERDISIPTKKSNIKNLRIARIVFNNADKNEQTPKPETGKYSLSRYSPCVNAGNPAERFNDMDGSKNDMGIDGGPEFFGE